MTVMETTTCFDLYWSSSSCLGNYMLARARGVEISTYAQFDKPNQNGGLYFMYFVLLSVSVMFHSVYPTPVLIRFVKLCVCRDLYTTRARMHIASP